MPNVRKGTLALSLIREWRSSAARRCARSIQMNHNGRRLPCAEGHGRATFSSRCQFQQDDSGHHQTDSAEPCKGARLSEEPDSDQGHACRTDARPDGICSTDRQDLHRLPQKINKTAEKNQRKHSPGMAGISVRLLDGGGPGNVKQACQKQKRPCDSGAHPATTRSDCAQRS